MIASLAAAKAAFDAAAAKVATVPDWSDFVGNPGLRLADYSGSEDDLAFEQARSEYIRAHREHHACVRGPMLREYYLPRP